MWWQGMMTRTRNDGRKMLLRIFDININTEPPTLHPGLAEDSTSGTVLRQVFEGLSRD